jgi:hypothetical protein
MIVFKFILLFKDLAMSVNYKLRFSLRILWFNSVNVSSFLSIYYRRNELLWVDGFLFDFLQKKTADLWIRKFLIYTGFLFSERLVFESVVRVYLDNLIWPMHHNSYFEASNVSEMLLVILYLYFALFITLFSYYVFLII